MNVAVQCNLTVAVGHLKYGHVLQRGASFTGEILLGDIGLSAQASTQIASGELLTDASVRKLLPQRPEDSNKGTFGKAMVVAGSVNYIGAAALASEGAMRSGAGLVTLACPGDLLPMLSAKLTETTFLLLPSDLGVISGRASDKLLKALEGYAAMLVGCGIGQESETGQFVKSLLGKSEAVTHRPSAGFGFGVRTRTEEVQEDGKRTLPPLVLDGDALNIIAQWDEWWTHLPANSILTPHPGEMARLTGTTVDEVQADRVALAKSSAAKWGQVVVLKGAATVIAQPKGKAFVSPFSNPALATAGTGDVLAGVIVGFLAQGLDPLEAACVGVYLHAMSGEALRAEYGVAGGLAGELPRLLALAQKKLREGE